MLKNIIRNAFSIALNENEKLSKDDLIIYESCASLATTNSDFAAVRYSIKATYREQPILSKFVYAVFRLNKSGFKQNSIGFKEVSYDGKNGEIIKRHDIDEVRKMRNVMFLNTQVPLNKKIEIFKLLKEFNILSDNEQKAIKFR